MSNVFSESIIIAFERTDLPFLQSMANNADILFDIISGEEEDGFVECLVYKEQRDLLTSEFFLSWDEEKKREEARKMYNPPELDEDGEPWLESKQIGVLLDQAQKRTPDPRKMNTAALTKKERVHAKRTDSKRENQDENLYSPISETENEWAETLILEELKNIQGETAEHENATVGSVMQSEGRGVNRKKRKSLGRTNQIKTRLTDSELLQFERRLKKSGLTQSDFLRNAALTGRIVIEDHSVADVALLDELALIRAELGRQGGLLKMVIRPNQGQRELNQEEREHLIRTVRDIERTIKKLGELEVKVTHGNHNASDK